MQYNYQKKEANNSTVFVIDDVYYKDYAYILSNKWV